MFARGSSHISDLTAASLPALPEQLERPPFRLRAPSPIIVGVSGHRDLRDEDIPFLAHAVDAFFESLAAKFPDSDILVLSGCAEGSDQLVAARAHAHGHPIVGLLPMPLADFEADFETPEALADFRAALAACVRVVELPWVPHPGRDSSDPHVREVQYALLAEEIVANSAVLLALWNGIISGRPGGTDAVVASARRRSTEGALSADDSLTTFIYHIVTPRRSHPQTEGEPFSAPSLDDAHDRVLRSMQQQNRWNRDAAALWAGAGEAVEAGRTVVERTFMIADTLAIAEQVIEQRAFLCVYLLAAVATLIFGTYSSLLPDADYLLAIDVAITIAAFVAFAVASSRNAPDRFQDYRALAEGLRVQAAWSEAGLRADVADHYTNRHRGELDLSGDDVDEHGGKLDWIRRTVRVARQLADFGMLDRRDERSRAERMHAVLEGWIEAQAGYFGRASARKDRAARRCRVLWRAMALAALLTTIALLVAVTVPPFRHFGDGPAKSDAFFVIGMLTIGSALLQNYAEKRAFGTLAKRYAVMHRAFASAALLVRGELEAGTEDSYSRRILLELGKDALAENAEWIIAMRDRPLESVLNP